MHICNYLKIILLKEEVDSSHINQSYNQQVSTCDKVPLQGILLMLWNDKNVTRGVLDQCNFMLVGLKMVNFCTREIFQF